MYLSHYELFVQIYLPSDSSLPPLNYIYINGNLNAILSNALSLWISSFLGKLQEIQCKHLHLLKGKKNKKKKRNTKLPKPLQVLFERNISTPLNAYILSVMSFWSLLQPFFSNTYIPSPRRAGAID